MRERDIERSLNGGDLGVLEGRVRRRGDRSLPKLPFLACSCPRLKQRSLALSRRTLSCSQTLQTGTLSKTVTKSPRRKSRLPRLSTTPRLASQKLRTSSRPRCRSASTRSTVWHTRLRSGSWSSWKREASPSRQKAKRKRNMAGERTLRGHWLLIELVMDQMNHELCRN